LPLFAPTPFKVPPGISFRRINRLTGSTPLPGEGDTLLEAFKLEERPTKREEGGPQGRRPGGAVSAFFQSNEDLNDLWEMVLPKSEGKQPEQPAASATEDTPERRSHDGKSATEGTPAPSTKDTTPAKNKPPSVPALY
jgi:hypothetical protein